MQKVKGIVKITEFTSLSDPEDYRFDVTTESGNGAAQQNLIVAVQGLQEDMVKLLLQYARELSES